MYDYQSNHSTESPLIFKVTNMIKCKYIYGFSDIDECKGNHSCHVNAICTNTNGSYLCECQPGFNGNGQSCTGEYSLSAIKFGKFLLEFSLALEEVTVGHVISFSHVNDTGCALSLPRAVL